MVKGRSTCCIVLFFLILLTTLHVAAANDIHKIRTVLSFAPPASLHPHDSGSEEITNYLNQIFDTLTKIDEDGKLQPALATRWYYENDKLLIMELRHDITFHNGEPFTADAVVNTFRLYLDPNQKVDNRFYWGYILNVRKLNKYKIAIGLSRPDNLLPHRLATIGQIIPPRYYKKVGRQYFSSHPVGTGPYIFDGFMPNGSIHLLVNPKYWNGKSQIDEIELYFPASIDDAVNMLIKNELDFVPRIPGHYTMQISKLHNLKITKNLSYNSTIIMLNTKKEGILKNLLVRQALRIGLNIDDILKYGYHGNGRVADAITHNGELFHPTDIQKTVYNQSKAKFLLKKAGDIKNEPLNIAVIKSFELLGAILATQLKSLGFKPRLNFVTAEGQKDIVLRPNKEGKKPIPDILVTYCAHRFANGAFPMLILMHSMGTWSMTEDIHLDNLLDNAVIEQDEEKQAHLFRSASNYINDNALILPGFRIGEIYGMKKDLNYKPNITGYIYFANLGLEKGKVR